MRVARASQVACRFDYSKPIKGLRIVPERLSPFIPGVV
jgi:hypothetical protein